MSKLIGPGPKAQVHKSSQIDNLTTDETNQETYSEQTSNHSQGVFMNEQQILEQLINEEEFESETSLEIQDIISGSSDEDYFSIKTS